LGHDIRAQSGGLLSSLGLQQSRLRHDGNLLLSRSDGQLRVNGQRRSDRQGDTIAHKLLETFLAEGDPIAARQDGHSIIKARLVRGERLGDAGIDIEKGDGCARDNGSGGIGDGTSDITRVCILCQPESGCAKD
jgi:hypothetical protein